MIIDVIDCLLCNAGCCNMKHVTLVCALLDSALMQLTVVDIQRNPPQSADV